MNARDKILSHPGLLATADAEVAALLDTYRAEVLHEAADMVALDRDSSLPARGRGAWRKGMTRALDLLQHLAAAGEDTRATGESPRAAP